MIFVKQSSVNQGGGVTKRKRNSEHPIK